MPDTDQTAEEFRIEEDSLGSVKVPAKALYGAQTQRAVENYPISGMRAHPALVRATVLIKRAAAMANRDTGRLDARTADAIIQASDEILGKDWRDHFSDPLPGDWQQHFVVDVYQAGAGTSHNMNINEVLANRAIEILGGERDRKSVV